ncbi:MAG: hypothetical protein A2498_09505 [Lentisphaerae bacterium RIFOXYC12_FULL_60_16]|nr:MAG: hypothetical protein A2498_09505 [Lentisphaerae bacterium RIFOXYC12_FULL_60_16]OGV75395.1 MAG: hypothetical protein A2340_13350 [Lentisphaerae bacterium RIFOXYB12_FULL_60_10]
MFVTYWNLKTNPFLNTFDRSMLFAGDQHEEAIARFTFLAESGRLAGLLTGPYGVGKSTVLQHVALAVEPHLPVIRMDAIPEGQLPMLRHILARMKIEGPAGSLPEALMTLGNAASDLSDKLTRTLLCIDEAHYLATDNGLYLVHYLTNLRLLNTRTQKETPLFTIILAGIPELLAAVQADPSLNQRMHMVYTLAPLDESQTTAYIQEHMRAVGGDLWVFTKDALAAIHRFSGGIPRTINLLCDTALMLGFAAKANHVEASIITQAATDTGIAARQSPHPAPEIIP